MGTETARTDTETRLKGGPHNGVIVTGVAGVSRHFFLFDCVANRMSYYERSQLAADEDEDFEHREELPHGAVGVIYVQHKRIGRWVY